jgi:hypothetical protein
MAKPVSKGIGTGAAQVYDYSRIDNAMNQAFNRINLRTQREEATKAARQQKRDDAIRSLRGEFGKFDSSKVKEVDKEVIREMVKSGYDQLQGHFEDIHNGDPEWTSKYMDIIGGIKDYISNSADTKTWEENRQKEMEKGGYSESKFEELADNRNTPGRFINDQMKDGVHKRDQIIGDLWTKIDAASEENVMYNMNKSDTTLADGTRVVKDSKVWKDDSEAFPTFLANVKSSHQLMNDINIMYSHLPEDERYRKAFDDYKVARKNEIFSDTYEEASEDKEGKTQFSWWNSKTWLPGAFEEKGLGDETVTKFTVAKRTTGEPFKIKSANVKEVMKKGEGGELVGDEFVVKNFWPQDGKIYATIGGTVNVEDEDGKISKKTIAGKVVQLAPSDYRQMATALGINSTYEELTKRMKTTARVVEPGQEGGQPENDDPLNIGI